MLPIPIEVSSKYFHSVPIEVSSKYFHSFCFSLLIIYELPPIYGIYDPSLFPSITYDK